MNNPINQSFESGQSASSHGEALTGLIPATKAARERRLALLKLMLKARNAWYSLQNSELREFIARAS